MPFRKKGSPYWYYDISVQGARLRGSTGQKSKAAAKKVEDRIRRDAAEPDKKPQFTLSQAVGHYWATVAERQSSATTTKYQSRNLIAGLGKHTMLQEIAARHVSNYAARRRATVSDSSVNREIELLRRVMNHAADSLDADVPKVNWKALKYREPQERVRELYTDEERRLFEALRPDLHGFVRFALITGARKSSITGLRWADIDFDARTMRFKQKGDRYHQLPLTTELVTLLSAQPRVGPFVFTYVCQRSTAKRKAGDRYPLTNDAWKKPWAQALKDAGIEDYRFHDNRHTAATRMVRKTGNLKIAQRQLGHSDIASTARYAHVNDDDLREAMESVENQDGSRNPHAIGAGGKPGGEIK